MKKYYFYPILVISFQLFITSLTAQNSVILTSGAGVWKPPPGVKSFYVQLWGGGAGGNASWSASQFFYDGTGGGGGGSSFSQSIVYTVTAAKQASGYGYKVGTGGAVGANGTNSFFENCFAIEGELYGSTRRKSPVTGEVAVSTYGGSGGKGWKNFFTGDIWQGGGGGSGRTNGEAAGGQTAGDGYHGYGGDGTGGGGKTGEYGAGAPGGGGSGNQAGARGEIRIFYNCDYTPGTIENQHTVPFPAEWPAGTDLITNVKSPTGFGYTFSWESSTDNVNWATVPGASQITLALPAIQQDTWYRRVINGCDATKNRSNVIKITVFKQIRDQSNGIISGNVKTSKTKSPVPGIKITVTRTTPLRGSPANYTRDITTNDNGEYSMEGLFYGNPLDGDSTDVYYTLTPSKPGHIFIPANTTVKLSSSTFSRAAINFIDTAVYAITGRITQTCVGCITGSINTFGIGNVKVSVNTLGVFDAASDSLRKDSIGYYSMIVLDPKTYTFTPTYLNHHFDSITRTINVSADVADLNFKDTTTRIISGKLTDVAGKRIGSGSLIFEGIYRVKNSTPTKTFRKKATININDSTYSVRLPAGSYTVIVENFTSAYLPADLRHINSNDLIDFFNVRAIETDIYADTSNVVRNLVYHRPPTIILTGLTDTLCNNDSLKNPGIIFRSNIRKYLQVNVFEGPPSLNNRIQTSDPRLVDSSDANSSDFLRIFTNVTDLSDATKASEKLFRLVNKSTAFMLDTFLIPGAPETKSPYFKPFELRYTDRYGRPADSITRRATVTGTFNPVQSFVTSFPEKPYLILHAPPGDQSYSFWSKDITTEVSSRYSVAKDSSRNEFVDISFGPKISITAGPVSFEAAVVAGLNLNFNHSSSTVTGKEEVSSVTNNVRFETKKNDFFLQGTSGDVYVGGGKNYKVGSSITVDFDETQPPGGCSIKKQEVMIMSPESFRTEFAYTEDHIVSVIIPIQQKFADSTTDEQKKKDALEQISIWQQVIKNNDQQKKDAAFKLNRSFSNGVVVEESQTGTLSKANTLTYNVSIDTSIAKELGLYYGGLGASGGVDVTISETQGYDATSTKTTSTTMGYHLEDDDRGDYYSVDIKTDPVYGTPVFDLVAGTSSCPPEEGAQNRDIPQIISGDLRINNLDPTRDTSFIITLANKSGSGEARFYNLSVDATTSTGLIIKSDDINLKVTSIPYYLAYGQSLDVPIKVEKSNKPDKIYSYPNIEFYLTDNCGILYVPNTYSTAKISLNYANPNGGIAFTAPLDGWVINSSSTTTLPITMGGYKVASIDSVTLQYKTQGVKIWKDGFTVKKSAITDPETFTYYWNVTGLQDSVHNLRLKLVSTDGSIVYSDYRSGVIDRVRPFLVGKPQPASQLYNPAAGEISFTYSESIDKANLNQGAVEVVRRSNNTLVPVFVREEDGKLIISPVNSLGSTVDSFRVIVKNIIDLYGNVKTKADTSFFRLDLNTQVTYTGSNVAKVFVTPASIAENSTGKMELHFKLKEKVTKITKVYFNLTGSATFNTDYIIAYDTIQRKVCDSGCVNLINIAVLNQFSGYPGFVNIDSSKTEAIIYIDPLEDAENEGNETITITLANGSDYKLQDSVTATGTILNSALPCPPANILYVNEKATGNNSGVSWANAMRSLKEALNSSCPGVTQIWVAKGTYKPTTNSSRDSSFIMKNNLAIYGGFAGTELALSQRNIRLNPTILSGDIGVANNNADNSYNVVRNISNGLNSTAILDGFTVTGGNGNGGGFGGYGAGIINVNSAASFYNCSIIGNIAAIYGGGMYNNGTSPLVVNSVFAGNTALYGGGLYNESAATKLINCSFSGNLAFEEGGAISTYGAVVPQITNSILWGNSSGIRNAGGSTPAVTYSIVQGGYAGTGNLNVDPLFILQPVPALGNIGDLKVQGCSPAVNVGKNAALPGAITTDLAGLPRVANTIIDMGAYERQTPATSVIIYVDASARGNNSGENWANAYNNISSAITELNFCSPGTTIQVATGNYLAPLNTTYNFDKLGASVLGGFPTGGGTRNPVANPVIVRGNVGVLKSVRIDGIRVQKQ